MFYQPKDGHGLPHDPFKAIVAPRPIGWISTINSAGIPNLAPYSFFNALGGNPPIVGFSSEGIKDTLSNIRATGEFVVNLVTRPLANAMNLTAARLPPGENEFVASGLTPVPCNIVGPPRVGESPAALECRLTQSIELLDLDGHSAKRWFTIGQVVGIHIADEYLKNGLFDAVAARTIARCGYQDYSEMIGTFSMSRPQVASPTDPAEQI